MNKYLRLFLISILCFSLNGCAQQGNNEPESEIEAASEDSILDGSTAESDNPSEESRFEVFLPELFRIPNDLLGQELQGVLDNLCPGLTEQKTIETSVTEELKQERDYIITD